jgi:dienelactone hydrolase
MAETAKFTSNGKSIMAELFMPAVAAANGGVIVIAHGTDGLLPPWGKQILGYGEALAKEGFVALIPHYFDSTGTAPGFRDLEPLRLHGSTWQQTVADAVAHAQTLPGADPARVGLLGFSLGGYLCLRLRSMAKILVEFFAPVLDLAPAKGGKLYAQVHHGDDDKEVLAKPNYFTVVDMLKTEGAVCDPHLYEGANHGFTGTDEKNTDARKESRALTLKFFADHL